METVRETLRNTKLEIKPMYTIGDYLYFMHDGKIHYGFVFNIGISVSTMWGDANT